MKKIIGFLSVTLMCSASPIMAGTIVTLKSDDGNSTIMTDGKYAKMTTGEGSYIIVDYKTNAVKIVDAKRKEVMLLRVEDLPKGGRPPKVSLSIKNLGAGPAIAGYQTKKFDYKVNGKSCGIIYGSIDAYQLEGVKALFHAMQTIAKRQQAMMGGFAGMIDDCTLGDIKMSDHVNTIGVPMRTEKNGKIDSEIVKIQKNTSLPNNAFSIPSSYKTKTVSGEIKKAQQSMGDMQQQMQKYQPQIQQMMKQMQDSGQMPPGVMEQLRQYQQ